VEYTGTDGIGTAGTGRIGAERQEGQEGGNPADNAGIEPPNE
jgi:hypothetical protein